jgi:hypothetical protein
VGMYLIRKLLMCERCLTVLNMCPHKNLFGHLCYTYLRSSQSSKKLKTGSTRQVNSRYRFQYGHTIIQQAWYIHLLHFFTQKIMPAKNTN